tara:strand:- start:403 stop:570 length:168 start_codon:yes stop_codon:yes gene_type:complete
MVNQIFFKKLKDLYFLCLLVGFKGTYEEFLLLQAGDLFNYINLYVDKVADTEKPN